MTAEEFERGYAERSKVSVEWLREHDMIVAPCDCEEDDCRGWQMVNADLYLDDRLYYAGLDEYRTLYSRDRLDTETE